MLLRFGPNELNPVRFELRRSHQKIRLAPRPMELLLILVDCRGKLVSREEIGKRLWPGLDVDDLDARINTAIAQIRSALNDNSGKPRYLETVIGKGYRFTEAVEEITVAEVALQPTIAPAEAKNGTHGPTLSEYALIPDLLLEGPVASKANRVSHSAHLRFTVPTVMLLLSVLVVVWRFAGTTEQRERIRTLVPTQATTSESENPVSASALSPDARFLAYADTSGLFVKELQTGRSHVVPAPAMRIARLSWFPDETRLLLGGFGQSGAQIWIVSVLGNKPALFQSGGENSALSTDGQRVAYTSRDGKEIWIANVNGAQSSVIARAGRDEAFSKLFWAARGTRLSYQLRQSLPSVAQPRDPQAESNYRWCFASRDVRTGKVTAKIDNVEFESAIESTDGLLYYLRSAPFNDEAKLGIWAVRIDPSTGAFSEEPKQAFRYNGNTLDGISIAANGKQIAAVMDQGRAHVYVASVHFPGPVLTDIRRLSSDNRTDFPHAWDAASESVYFESNRTGTWHIYRQGLSSRYAEMLSVGDGEEVMANVTNGGRTLVYEQSRGQTHGIYRANRDGGAPTLVYMEGTSDEWQCPFRAGLPCVLRETNGHAQFVFYELDLLKGRGKELARTAWAPSVLGDWSLSYDGLTVAIPNHDAQAPSVRLVPLDGSKQSTIVVRQAGKLWGLHWSADKSGFFAESRTDSLIRLEFITLQGEAQALREAHYNTWAVPSPDGQKIAFPGYTEERNVWIWR